MLCTLVCWCFVIFVTAKPPTTATLVWAALVPAIFFAAFRTANAASFRIVLLVILGDWVLSRRFGLNYRQRMDALQWWLYFLNYLQWSLFPKDNRIYKASGLQLPPTLPNHSIKKGVPTWVFLQAEIPTVLTSSQDVDYAVSDRELPVPQLSPPWMSLGDGSYPRGIVWMLDDTVGEDHHI